MHACQLSLADHFAIAEPQNPSIDEFYAASKRRSTDFEALKLSNARSGASQAGVWITKSGLIEWEPLLNSLKSLFCQSSLRLSYLLPLLNEALTTEQSMNALTWGQMNYGLDVFFDCLAADFRHRPFLQPLKMKCLTSALFSPFLSKACLTAPTAWE